MLDTRLVVIVGLILNSGDVLDTYLIFFVSPSIASLSIQLSESDERHERVTVTAVLRKGKKMSRTQLVLEDYGSHGRKLKLCEQEQTRGQNKCPA